MNSLLYAGFAIGAVLLLLLIGNAMLVRGHRPIVNDEHADWRRTRWS